jgi:hypothetical protein
MSIVLSEPDHEPENLGIPAAGEPAIDAAGAKPKKPRLTHWIQVRVSEDLKAKFKALGGSKWLRKVVHDSLLQRD